jgi:regulator of sigma E protease
MGSERGISLEANGMLEIRMLISPLFDTLQATFAAIQPCLAAADETSFLTAWGGTLWNIFRVMLGLGFVIFVHELGHFLAAKFFGVKCEKFYVGFDVPLRLGPIQLPAKLFHFQWGETEYGIGSIPLGGYVKMLGQDDDPRRMEEENARIRTASPDAEAVGRPQYDPRSFPAKSVFARMVIISAGVIMNIIFGIILAAIAFRIGVPYESTIIGDVLPGDPAWKAGLQSGDHIVKVAEMTKSDKHLSFRDLRESIVLAGFENPTQPIPVTVERGSEERSFQIVGTTRHEMEKRAKPLISLGFTNPRTTQLADLKVFLPTVQTHWAGAEEVLPAFQPGDKIVSINGEKLAARDGFRAPLLQELNLRLHPRFDQAVTVQVERARKGSGSSTSQPPELVELEWKPLPMRTLGVAFEAGPVAAVQSDSAAEKAGVQEGDRLETFQGEPIRDAFALPLMVAKQRGKTVKLTLRRASGEGEVGEVYPFEWQVPEQFVLRDSSFQFNPVGLELPGSGLVFTPSNKVAAIQASEQDPAATGLLPGETVLQMRLDPSNDPDTLEAIEKVFSAREIEKLIEGRDLKDGYSSMYLHTFVQHLPLGTKLTLRFMRDGIVQQSNFAVANDREWSWFDRGVNFMPGKLNRVAASVPEAFQLGWHEIQDKASDVLRFLRMMFTGKISLNMAGGPGMIFYAATDAASESTTKLLMFLTMLSANLAVINFLPIPALDGGHMMFLIAEAIRGKPVDEALQMRLTVMGVLALLALMIFVTFNDVVNFAKLWS